MYSCSALLLLCKLLQCYCGILNPLQGKVVLPLPSVTTLAQTAFTSPDRHSVVVHVLETAVVTWMKQVKMALYCNPTGAISRKAGKFAGPLEEIKVSIKKKRCMSFGPYCVS